jgi:hypothetical protein
MAVKNVLQIINEVRELIGMDRVSDFESKDARVYLTLLNQVLTEISDFGDWQELYVESTVSAIPGQSSYPINTYYDIKRIVEVTWGTERSALFPVKLNDLRAWRRGSSRGTPRQFSIQGVDAMGNPKVLVHPVPTTAAADGMNISFVYFARPNVLDSSSISDEPPFDGDLLVKGLYFKVLMEESNYQLTARSQLAQREYMAALTESLNRYNADTSDDIQFVPPPYY